MIKKYHHNMRWLEFELFEDFPLIHGCFMRHGGVSTGSLASLNLGQNVGDHSENLTHNLKIVAEALSLKKIVTARLCHSNDIQHISTDTAEIPVSDALMTSTSELGIAITQGDCQAAIFYDPIHHVMANAHCGWRGSTLNIYENVVKAMSNTFDSKPADLLVGISPSLGPNHAEFIHYQKEFPECLWQFKKDGNLFDFWEISRWQLENAGVLSHHIQIANIDTYSNQDYFSYRRSIHEKIPQCGRQATVCALLHKNKF